MQFANHYREPTGGASRSEYNAQSHAGADFLKAKAV